MVTLRLRLIQSNGNTIPVEAFYRLWEKTSEEVYLNCYYRDISERIVLEDNYQRNIVYRDMTVRNALASFQLNITKNMIREGLSTIREMVDLGKEGTLDGFMRSIEPKIHDGMNVSFHNAFCRDALLKAFAEGRNQISLEHGLEAEANRHMWICTNVDMFRNPKTGDVEGFIYGRDLSNEHILTQLMNTVVDSDYDFIISVDWMKKTFRTFLSNGGGITSFH